MKQHHNLHRWQHRSHLSFSLWIVTHFYREPILTLSLLEMIQGRTTVMVAHRLSTIRNANSIAVIQDGAIVEEGSHHELMSRPGGAYCTLIRLQQHSSQRS